MKCLFNKNRFMAILTAISICLTFVSFHLPIFIQAEAEGNMYTTNYLSAYIQGLVETPAKEWGDAGESTQCVELVKYYVEQLWGYSTKNRALGNGNEMYKIVAQAYPETFTAIEYYDGITLMPGDIISYHSNGWAADYGHVALVYEVHGNTYRIAEQWQYCETVRTNTKVVEGGKYGEPYTIIGIARPNSSDNRIDNITTPPQNITILSDNTTAMVGGTMDFYYTIDYAYNAKGIGIDKDGSRYASIPVGADSGKVSYTFTETGTYCVVTEGSNSNGYACCDGVWINVVEPTAPQNISISSDNTTAMVGGTMELNYSIDFAYSSAGIGIDKDGKRYDTLPLYGSPGTERYTFKEAGTYCIITEGSNDLGYRCCDGIWITVVEPTVP